MDTYVLIGGYSYDGVIQVEADTIEEAAEKWYDRFRSNGLAKVDGVLWPCFGDMHDDAYAVINFDTEETLTRKDILRMYNRQTFLSMSG